MAQVEKIGPGPEIDAVIFTLGFVVWLKLYHSRQNGHAISQLYAIG